jgi:hypothetical protein
MDEGESEPLLVMAYTDDWSESREVVLKLREPGAVAANRHGDTALACELVCGVVARVLGFSVPDYAIVEVSEQFASAVQDDAVRARLEGSVGANFGTAYLAGCRSWSAQKRTLGGELQQTLTDLLEYDSVILDGDRTAEHPNLLWDGDDCYPIDHSLALQVYAQTRAAYESFLNEPLLLDEQIQKHVCYQLLAWKELDLELLAQRWRGLPMSEILEEVRSVLPPEWEANAGDYDRIFDFLGRRDNHFEAIIEQIDRLIL